MKRFYVYLWKDPKDGTPRYVGKGQDSRVWYHLEYEKKKFRIVHLLRKRFREGYICLPQIIWVNSEPEALELEVFLISEIGRLDLGKGPLFNLTDGGEGVGGRKVSDDEKRRRRESRLRTNAAKHGRSYEDWEAMSSVEKSKWITAGRIAARYGLDRLTWMNMSYEECRKVYNKYRSKSKGILEQHQRTAELHGKTLDQWLAMSCKQRNAHRVSTIRQQVRNGVLPPPPV